MAAIDEKIYYQHPKAKKIFLCVTIIICSAVVFCSALLAISKLKSRAATLDEPYSIIIVAGQSNASGEKSFASQITTVPLGSHPADSATKIVWSMGNNLLVPTWNNSTAGQFKNLVDSQPSGWFGPEVNIARDLYDAGRRNIIVVKVGYGGQLLSNAGSSLGFNPDWNVNSNNESYDKLITRINDVKTMLTGQGDTYTVDGFYWMQGESDAIYGGSHSTNYEANLTSLINGLKVDAGFHPSAKIVLGKQSVKYCVDNIWDPFLNPAGCNIPASVGSNYWVASAGNTNVRAGLQSYADSHSDTEIVETEDLTRTSSDWVHLIWSSELTLGSRMAAAAILPPRVEGSNDYDSDGVVNNQEDANSNGNLGDDDSDSDGTPDYLDAPPGGPGPDVTPPTGAIQINSGVAQTTTQNVTLQLSGNDDQGMSGLEMRIGSDTGFTGSNWQPFASSSNWTLSAGYGQKTVYYQLRDVSTNQSIIYSDDIELAQSGGGDPGGGNPGGGNPENSIDNSNEGGNNNSSTGNVGSSSDKNPNQLTDPLATEIQPGDNANRVPAFSQPNGSTEQQTIKPAQKDPQKQKIEDANLVKFAATASISLLSLASMSIGAIMLVRYIR